LPQESFSDCIWYTYIDFNEKPPYFRYDTGDNTAKENESTYYEIQEELKQFGYTIEDVYIDHDTICGDIVSINKELAQPQGEWVDLTDDEILEASEDSGDLEVNHWRIEYCRAVIAKFKSMNTPPVVPQGEPIGWTAARNLVDDGYGHSFTVISSEPASPNEPYVPVYTTPPVVPQCEPVAYTYKDEVILAKHWTADYPPSGWTPLIEKENK
jgi:hypothetical protein